MKHDYYDREDGLLAEQLRSVPRDAVLRIDTPNALGCMDTRSIPVGRLCNEAADALGVAPSPAPDKRKPWELTSWTCARARVDNEGMHCPEDKCRDCPNRTAGVKESRHETFQQGASHAPEGKEA